ncbi:MAG: hypothetical protein R3Y53_07065 [Bacillota bacterium]
MSGVCIGAVGGSGVVVAVGWSIGSFSSHSFASGLVRVLFSIQTPYILPRIGFALSLKPSFKSMQIRFVSENKVSDSSWSAWNGECANECDDRNVLVVLGWWGLGLLGVWVQLM